MQARTGYAMLTSAILAAAAAEGLRAAPAAGDYVGRWNIAILGQTDTFAAAGLKVTQEDGRLGGKLVWKWGSWEPIRDVTVEEGELRFARGGETFRAKLEGDRLRGKCSDGTAFEGRRAPEMCSPAGTWKVAAVKDPEQREARLILEETDGKIGGSAVDPDGNRFEIRDAKLDGYVLDFKAVLPESPDRQPSVRCEIRGDVLVGKVDMTRPGETEKLLVEIRGTRDRKWGAPVALLANEGTAGWGPRNPSAPKFGWKVEGGVLRNSPPDVDIMSERKLRDFKLHLEYRVPSGSNSGIYIRGRDELQIAGDDPKADPHEHGNMAIYSLLSPRTNALRDLKEWQSVDIALIGRWLTVALNGEVVHDNVYLEGITGGAICEKEGEPGPLLLQGDHGPVEYRNIVVTPAE